MTTDAFIKLTRLQLAIEAFARVTHDGVSIRMFHSFLEIARDEGRPLVEIARAIGLKEGTSSRLMLDLGPKKRDNTPGYQLVEGRIDPVDMRIKRFFLTERGRILTNEIISILDGEK